jgi:hypothetical protein
MPCPYFIPTERFDDAGWAHAKRLPLGAGFRGLCGAPGHAGTVPTDEELKHECNLGYARNCSRLPKERDSDAVRFSVLRDRDGQVSICYISELNYLPHEQGTLHYALEQKCWSDSKAGSNVKTLAQAFLESYLRKRDSSDSVADSAE